MKKRQQLNKLREQMSRSFCDGSAVKPLLPSQAPAIIHQLDDFLMMCCDLCIALMRLHKVCKVWHALQIAKAHPGWWDWSKIRNEADLE